MESVKKTTPKKKLIDDNAIISKYIEIVLDKSEEPKNVFSFCKEAKITEADFYTFFGSLEVIKHEIWIKFFMNATTTIHNDVAFESYSNKNKLLTLYFTLFEILTLNRSYVLFSLKERCLKILQVIIKCKSVFNSRIVFFTVIWHNWSSKKKDAFFAN
jgi:hypothetical protein